MANCCNCSAPVTVGKVICPECAQEVELGKVRKVLEACRLEEWEAFTGPERILVIAKEKAMCEFCVDYGNGDACIKCPRAKGVTHGELKRFHRAIIRLLEAVMEAQP